MPKTVKQWLSRQAFWQVHLPAPKSIDRPHYEVTTPNEMHQFDLLYIPSDTLYGNKYKYILAGIDAVSRFKDARPLRTKQARDVAEMIADIYEVRPLKYAKIMTGFLSLCSSFPRAKFPQEVYCTIESWGDTHKRSVCLKSISGLLNH